MEEAAKELDGTHEVPVSELLTEDFMRANTEFASFSEMVDASGLTVESADDLANPQWEAIVQTRTRFESWQDLLATAVEQYTLKKLGFD